MLALKKADGLFGLTLAKGFVSRKEEERDLEHFLDHLDFAIEVMGIDNICFGFDFMDYLDDDFENAMIKEVPDATKAHLIIEGMKKRGYSKEEIKKVAWDNFCNRYSDKLYKRSK